MATKKSGSLSADKCPLSLERILGITVTNNAGICCNNNGELFYSAGAVSVCYNVTDNIQQDFYQSSGKSISAQTMSPCSKFLATGERGHQPCVAIWDTTKKAKIASLAVHKNGISALAFSPDSRYLVSVGYRHDKQIIVWDWAENKVIQTLKLSNKVYSISFHPSGSYFVTCGDRHLKWWFIDYSRDGRINNIQGKPAAITEDMKDAVFLDIKCGSGSFQNSVYCVTSTGMVCAFSESTRMMEKWIQTESTTCFCLTILTEATTPSVIAVGATDGVIRFFSPDTLNYISTVPLPSPISSTSNFPACYAINFIPSTLLSPIPKLAAVYADHSLFIWDISDLYNIVKFRSSLYHFGCIWDIQFIDSSNAATSPNGTGALPPGSFVTCSSDSTVRIWNIDPKAQRKSKWKSLYSRELLHTIDIFGDDGESDFSSHSHHNDKSRISHDGSVASTVSTSSASGSVSALATLNVSRPSVDISVGIPDFELPDKHQGAHAPRSMAVHPHGKELAVGDKSGRVKIFNLRTMEETANIHAHAAEILTMCYSPMLQQSEDGSWGVDVQEDGSEYDDNQNKVLLLASAGRDRLVHIYDATKKYVAVNTLDNHSSSVTSVKFTSDGKRLLSSGGDRTIVFSSVDGNSIQRIKSVQTPRGTINGMAVEATNKFAATSGQDKRVNIWNIHTGKHVRAYKSDNLTGELYKCDIDPSGTFISTCSFDKVISLYDFFSGDLMSQVTGHSELITGVKFSLDGRYLMSIGGDGCIMVWRIGEIYVKAMHDRLMELFATAQQRQHRINASRQSIQSIESSIPQQSVQSSVSQSTENKKKWNAVSNEGTFEILGKKVSAASKDPKLNKFTLELTQSDLPKNQEAKSPAKLAATVEDNDAVMCSDDENSPHGIIDDDFEDDEEHRFHANKSEGNEYESDFEVDASIESLDEAHNRVNNLEKSAINLENWLEDLLRNESKLNESVSAVANVAAPSPSKPTQDSEENVLGKSLSTRFFKNLKTSKPEEPLTAPVESQPSSEVPLDTKDDTGKRSKVLEAKRRETAAAVANMKDRLKAMGIIDATLKSPPTAIGDDMMGHGDEVDEEDHSNMMMPPAPPYDQFEHGNVIKSEVIEQPSPQFFPPPPPSVADLRKEVENMEIRDDDTASTVSASDEEEEMPTPIVPSTSEGFAVEQDSESNQSSQQQTQQTQSQTATIADNFEISQQKIKMTSEKCLKALRDLELAKKSAVASFEELMNMQSSFSGVSASQQNIPGHLSNIPINESVALQSSVRSETFVLLDEFRKSVASLSEISKHIEKRLGTDMDQSLESSSFALPQLSSMTPIRPKITGQQQGKSISLLSPIRDQTLTEELADNTGSSSSGRSAGKATITTLSTTGVVELEVSSLLEKYSDKLVDLIFEKMKAKNT